MNDAQMYDASLTLDPDAHMYDAHVLDAAEGMYA